MDSVMDNHGDISKHEKIMFDRMAEGGFMKIDALCMGCSWRSSRYTFDWYPLWDEWIDELYEEHQAHLSSLLSE